LCPILAFFEPLVELSDILIRVRLVLLVRDAVDPGTGILSQTPECLIQLLFCDQVSNRGNCRFESSLASSAILLMSVNLSFRAQRLVMFPFSRFVRLLPPSLQWVPWPPVSGALRFPIFIGTVGS